MIRDFQMQYELMLVNKIEEGNITRKQAVLLGVGVMVLSKGKSGGAIKSFTKHAVNRMIERGFSASNILKIKEGEAVKAAGRFGVQMR
ncbi:DUF4258 domain-containing protein [Apibacter adventoris]|nr:DUF4258 domain-containing protein [Apibacter adventoris]